MDWTKQGAEAFNYLKGIGNKVKQIALQLTEVEIKVEDATNNDPWGPHGKDMAEITRAAYELESYKQIMGVIARRLQDQGEDWRHVYKSLLLLEYMSKHGPQKVVEELVSNVGVIEKLTYFEYKDANAKDWGLNVRQRAKELVGLINDPERMRAERHKAKTNETKYTGVSSDDLRGGGFGLRSSSGAGSGFGAPGGSSRYSSGGGLGGVRSSSAGGFASSSGRSLYDDYDEPTAVTADKDPKEATRERIERLRRDGAVDGDDPGHDKGSLPPALKPALKPGRAAAAEAAADAAAARGPKKLSDVRVNPGIAASLGQLAPPPPAAAAKPGSSSNGALAPAAPAAPSTTDLLADLDAPAAPAPAGSASWSAFEGNGGAAQDLLSSAAPAAAAARPAAVDPFDAFGAPPAAAPPSAAHSAPADPFAPAKPSAAPAPSMAPPPSALSEDLFSAAPSSLGGLMQAQPGAAQHQQQYDAFGAFAQAPRQQQAGWQPQAAQQPALGLQGQAYPVQQQPPPLGGFQQGLGPQASFGALSSGLQQGGPIAGPGRSAGPGGGAAAQVAPANAPLNPAAAPIVSSRSKDPFADLAAF